MFESQNVLRVASYQGLISEGNIDKNLATAHQVMTHSHNNCIDVVCMPECFLHGYFSSHEEAMRHSISLKSSAFDNLCAQFKHYSPTLIIGLNEKDGEHIYNTAVVIENGECIGKYRKTCTYKPYDYYTLGDDFPIFSKKGVNYGIIICYDSVFREPAFITASRGAQVIFCPMFNRASKHSGAINFLHSQSHFIARAYDNNCWFISSDIIFGDKRDIEVCQGYASIVDNTGKVVAQALPFSEALLTYDIPLASLNRKPSEHLITSKKLYEIALQEYSKNILDQ